MTKEQAELVVAVFNIVAAERGVSWHYKTKQYYPDDCQHCDNYGTAYNPRDGVCYEESGGCGGYSYPSETSWQICAYTANGRPMYVFAGGPTLVSMIEINKEAWRRLNNDKVWKSLNQQAWLAVT